MRRRNEIELAMDEVMQSLAPHFEKRGHEMAPVVADLFLGGIARVRAPTHGRKQRLHTDRATATNRATA